ncbi:E3 ubiquitin-protein ligase TRIM63-like [Pelmatolapia mariae]|uniref:E3 ubiquitin-protein ligase TRIM63-like n=1 Tax=Pelmatolapia mariae TaxID=158779 RepID=UPI002FE61B23
MESLEKQLSCPICLDMFTKPVVILPCQHNLCRGCAGDLFESQNPYRLSGGTFCCPTCRFKVVLDRHGVYGLQRNLLVENIIDIYKQQLEKGVDPVEDMPLKDKDSEAPRCQEHEDERINIYCVTCATPTCSMCKVFGQHRDCQVVPLLAVYDSQRGEVRATIELLAAANSSVQVAMMQMEETRCLVEESSELQRRRLGESFDLLYALLEERKGELLERIDGMERDKMATLRVLAERYREQLQLSCQLQEKLQQSMEQSGTAHFLLTAKQLQQEAEQAVRAMNLQPPEPGYVSMEHLRVDTRKLEVQLQHIDFTQK